MSSMPSVAEIVKHYLTEHSNGMNRDMIGERLKRETGVGSASTLTAWALDQRKNPPRIKDVRALRAILACTCPGFSDETIRHAFELAAKAPEQAPLRTAGAVRVRDSVADAVLVIDDVIVTRRPDHVVLDVRVRNVGTRSANITRVAVRVVDRTQFLTAYLPSASYDLVVDGDYNEISVAHHVAPDAVDQFVISLGFAPTTVGYSFTAEMVVRFNGDGLTVSKRFTFDSCFERVIFTRPIPSNVDLAEDAKMGAILRRRTLASAKESGGRRPTWADRRWQGPSG